MTVCQHRPEEVGFFTSCALACGGKCECGAEVASESEEGE